MDMAMNIVIGIVGWRGYRLRQCKRLINIGGRLINGINIGSKDNIDCTCGGIFNMRMAVTVGIGIS